MTIWLALLRAVNLGGATQLSMPRLRTELERRGFSGVRTLLNSGNVVLRSRSGRDAEVVQAVADAIEKAGGRSTEIFLRSPVEWRAAIAQNPWLREAEADPRRLQMVSLRTAPPDAAWAALRAAVIGRERVEGRGRQAYIFYPDGGGRSKLTPQRIERKLGTTGTSRNWNTVLKLRALLGDGA
jgi:uncharacterized protein (DUF1697 family)